MTGFGVMWSEMARGFYDLERRTVVDALREAGCEPSQIDVVVVTHLHFDHAAALTRLDESGTTVPTFPEAEIVAQQTEWEDAMANKSTMTRTYLRSHLDPVRDRLRLVRGEAEIRPGLTVQPAPGHTWGQQAVRFRDEEGMVCFPGDVMPTVHHAGPAFNMGYDVTPYRNMTTKRELLARAAGEGWRLVLDHEPGDAVVRVAPDEDRPGRFTLSAVSAVSPP